MPRRGANEARVLTWRRWTRPHANPGRATRNRRWMRPPWRPLGASTRSSSSHLSERGERRETRGETRRARWARRGGTQTPRHTRRSSRRGLGYGRNGGGGRGEGCGRRRRALRRFSSIRRQKLFLGAARIGRNCRCLTHIDAAVGHGRRRRRPLERPRRHGPNAARYTRGNPDKLDVTLTRHSHSRRSSHARV